MVPLAALISTSTPKVAEYTCATRTIASLEVAENALPAASSYVTVAWFLISSPASVTAHTDDAVKATLPNIKNAAQDCARGFALKRFLFIKYSQLVRRSEQTHNKL